MYAIEVKGDANANLNDTIDRIYDGALADFVEIEKIVPIKRGGGMFAADGTRSISFVVHFRTEPTPDTRAALIAAIRAIVGASADIEEIEDKR